MAGPLYDRGGQGGERLGLRRQGHQVAVQVACGRQYGHAYPLFGYVSFNAVSKGGYTAFITKCE